MKKLFFLLPILMLLAIGCGDGSSLEPKDPGTVLRTTLPDVIGGNTLGGLLEIIDSSDYVKYSGYENAETVITSPTAAHIRVDGYVEVKGEKSTSNTVYLGIIKGNTINWLEELPAGKFSRYLYFREAASDYIIALLVQSRASYSYLCRIDVTNDPSADIQFLVPTTYVQAFNPNIRVLAKDIIDTVTTPTDESIALAFHDYIAKDLYYDFDSLTDRKPQDALSVLANGMAVCQGYANLYTALLRASGIKAQVYTGSNHAWNMVWWENDWHDVDVTWDDPVQDDGGDCDINTGQYCTSDFPAGDNLRYDYFDTDFTGDADHDGTVNLLYRR